LFLPTRNTLYSAQVRRDRHLACPQPTDYLLWNPQQIRHNLYVRC